MAGFATPRKNFNWLLQLDGLNAFQVQEFQPPTLEYPVKIHGAPMGLPDAKTPGKMKVGQGILKKVLPAFNADPWAINWFGKALAGGGYRGFVKNGFLVHVDPLAGITIDRWYLGACWPSKIEMPNHVTKSDDGDNLIETITLEMQFFYQESAVDLKALFNNGAAKAMGLAFPFGQAGV